jgi:hypothetical protein
MNRDKDDYLLARRLDAYIDNFPACLPILRLLVSKLSSADLREVVADLCGCSHCGTFGHEVPDCPESEWEWDDEQQDWRQA